MADETLQSDLAARIASICQQFEAAWQSGGQPSIEDFLSRVEHAERHALFLELVRLDSAFRLKAGQQSTEAEYAQRFAEYTAEISAMISGPMTQREQQGQVALSDDRNATDQELPQTEVWQGSSAASGERQAPGAEFSIPTSLESRDDTKEIRPASSASLSELPDVPGYEVLGVLGRGGMGVVIKARHRVLGRLVAIKLPLTGHLGGADERERFLREARAAARLHHPHICPIHEVGQIEGRPYLVLHFVSGKTLREWSAERKPSAREAASLLAAVAWAVGYAHQRGVVHRDLKPSNVMIEAESGEPVLMDFGLAKELGEEASLLTQSGQVMGTPAYMAPEQAAGRLHDVGPHSDVYALGAILYELICGRRPFEGGAGEVLKQVLTDEPPPPRKVNPKLHIDLETICRKALAKAPKDRYATANALADDLERFAAGEPILARREPAWRKMTRRVRRSSGVAAALLLLIAAVTVGSYFAVVARRATRLTNLKSQFEQSLQRGDWSAESLAQIDALVAEISKLDPQPVDDLAARVRTRLSSDIQSEIINTPSREMDLERYAQFGNRVKLVEARDPLKAKELHAVLEASLGGWKAVFELSAESSDPSLHFDSNQVRRVGGAFKANPTYDAIGRPRVLANTDAQGPARLEVTFDADWENVAQLGLLLSAGTGQEYAFVISAPDDRTPEERAKPNSQPPALTEAREKQKEFTADIFRDRVRLQSSVPLYGDDVRLKSRAVAPQEVPSGPLRMRATRDGDRLTFEINGQKVLECVDLFPLTASEGNAYGLRWPATVGLTSLSAERLLRQDSESPLEQGDQLYARGQWNLARQFYEKARLNTVDERRQEIEYKAALCELREGEADKALRENALRRFDALQHQSGVRFPMLAACQIWIDLVQQSEIRLANAQLDFIKTAFPDSKELALTLPDEDRMIIVNAYNVPGSLRIHVDKSMIERCERSEAALELIGAAAGWVQLARMDVIQSLAQASDFSEAMRKAQSYLAQLPVGSWEAAQILVEYAWIAREAHGDLSGPLNEVDRQLYQRPGLPPPALLGLLVERARLRAAQQNWGAAEADLDEFDRARRAFEDDRARQGIRDPDLNLLFSAAEANLLRGFLREHRGDIAGAMDAWRTGLENMRDSDGPLFIRAGPMDVLTRTILASLTDTSLTDNECDYSFQAVRENLKVGHSRLAEIVNNDELMRSVFSRDELRDDLMGMWRSPRGRMWARRLALRNTSRRDLILQPMLLWMTEHTSRGALNCPPTQQQTDLISIASQRLAEAVFSNALGRRAIAGLGANWTLGLTRFVGWQIADEELANQPELRGLLAYVLGQRRILKDDWDNAVGLLRRAHDDAGKFADTETGTMLATLAQFEIDHIATRKVAASLRDESRKVAQKPTSTEAAALRKRLMDFWRQQRDTPLRPASYNLASEVTWPADLLRRDKIAQETLAAANASTLQGVPRELVEILGASPGNHWEWIGAIALSHDAATLATGGSDGTVKLWKADDGRLLRTLVGHKYSVVSLAFSPSDEVLASASHDNSVRLWSAEGEELYTLLDPWVAAMAFTADGTSLVTGHREIGNGAVRVWDAERGMEHAPLDDQGAAVFALGLIGEDRLAAAQDKGEVRIWSLTDRKLTAKWTAHAQRVTALCATADGERLVSGGADLKLKVWEVPTATPPGETPQPLVDVAGGIYPPGFLGLTPDEKTLICLSGDGNLRRYDFASGTAAPPLSNGAGYGVVDRGRGVLIHSHGHNLVNRVDLASWESRPLIAGHAPAVSVAWSPDGGALATGYGDGSIQAFNAATGETARTFGTPSAVLWSISFSPDGSLIAAGRNDGKIILWEAASGAVVREWVGHPSPIARIAFNPAGDLLASGDHSGAVKLWKVADGTAAGEWKAHNGNVTGLAFTPDGKALASGGSDAAIRMWDLQGNELPSLEAPAAPVVDLAIDPTGRWLAAVENSGAVKLWTLVDRKMQFTYPKPDGITLPNRTITFSPDGQSFATAGSDGQVRIYDPRYYEDELPFPQTAIPIGPPAATIRQVIYSPDGRHLATANGDGTVYILRLAPAAGAQQ
jgi:WD40 repeat protein/serine/threonine protein kinase